MRKAAWCPASCLCTLYVIAFTRRINVGFASLIMGEDLNMIFEVLG